ncbi:MAG: caspase family protein [Bradyrhizobium sp.]|uniref:caspase family protein n=1 Tax=Bradyrhizobium sp. TaxID=376 RepID=UPI0025BC1C17|nr:caspase domain-containing protein [Bradyrhizobium sp.]MBI5262859.1 caspase family protein [Bradyrhizobium sp.]
MPFACRFRYAGLVVSLILAWVALATQPALAERKIAFVVGNSGYVNVPRLPNPRNDASDVITRLKGLGFEVIPGLDLDRNTFLASLARFGRAAEGADVALFFYAGHGLQVNGQNYLVPTDGKAEYEAELDIALIPVSLVMQQLSRGSRVNIVILDACRDNPFAKDLSRTLGTRSATALGRGLSRIQTASGTFIAFATQPDNVAQDGDGRNSPFTQALLAHIEQPGLSLPDLMIEVRNEVMRQTNGKQVPWDSSSLTGRFSFKIEGTITVTPEGTGGAKLSNPPTTPSVDQKALELAVWRAIERSNDPAAFEKFLTDFPSGVFASAARERIAALRPPAADVPARTPSLAPRDACVEAATIDDDFTASGRLTGMSHGVILAKGPNGGASFSRKRESRIVYPYGGSRLPRSGTLEWLINVSSGYFYSGGKLHEGAGCALIFTTDIQNGDVTWPGSAWLHVCNNGDMRFHVAGAKYEAGGRPEFRLEAKGTAFRYGEWHRIGVSYGSQGRYVMLDGRLVASDAGMTQQLGAGGTHQAAIDQPTIGESVSGFWPNNKHEGGFEGTLARFRASDVQRNWCVSR